MIQFLHNQTLITEEHLDPNLTVLNWLRRNRRHCGTKEGCASGDCGACTVTIGKVEEGKMRYETANSCLMLVSQLQSKQLISIENLKQQGALHPVQQAMTDCHASQCGFCTPGFVMSVFTLAKNGGGNRHAIETALAGNLCRCTGYRPIVEAAERACGQPVSDSFSEFASQTVTRLQALHSDDVQQLSHQGRTLWLPKTPEQLAALMQAYPQAKLVAGGTDLSLQITQQYRVLPELIAISEIQDLKQCERRDGEIYLGAGAALTTLHAFLQDSLPAFSQLLQRFAALQVRNQGTLGGNIANASPIGDTPPLLLALDAELLLQRGDHQRRLPLCDFFLSYRKTALQVGEFIHSIIIPEVTLSRNVVAWKVSKRREDDISAVFAAFSLRLEKGIIHDARAAFGGMAAIPQRAAACEQALQGQSLTDQTLEHACAALAQDFQPVTDFRASSAYRLLVAQNLLRRYFRHLCGETEWLEVTDYVA